jgi:two-component system, OmpR family, response regulator
MEPHVLIVEDDTDLREVLVRGLRDEGFAAQGVATGHELLDRTAGQPPDALIIDVGLPDTDGRDLCQALRAQGVQAPVLFLTARDSLPDRLSGFEAGGDDYVTKPFAFSEVIVRLRALLRRARPDGDSVVEVGNLRLDPVAHAARSGHQRADLTPTEFRLLAVLAARPGDAVRRHELVRAAWPHGAMVHDNTLDTYIARLRRKLRRLDDAPEIKTVHGVGYSIR